MNEQDFLNFLDINSSTLRKLAKTDIKKQDFIKARQNLHQAHSIDFRNIDNTAIKNLATLYFYFSTNFQEPDRAEIGQLRQKLNEEEQQEASTWQKLRDERKKNNRFRY